MILRLRAREDHTRHFKAAWELWLLIMIVIVRGHKVAANTGLIMYATNSEARRATINVISKLHQFTDNARPECQRNEGRQYPPWYPTIQEGILHPATVLEPPCGLALSICQHAVRIFQLPQSHHPPTIPNASRNGTRSSWFHRKADARKTRRQWSWRSEQKGSLRKSHW